MPQMLIAENQFAFFDTLRAVSDATVTFARFNVDDSVSFKTMNIAVSASATDNQTVSFSVGLYSLNGSTLSLTNSISRTIQITTTRGYFLSLTGTSATQNITPGTWWFGFLIRTGASLSLRGASTVDPANAFPGSFIGGRMTVSTAALPGSYATSDLDVTGADAMFIPNIILSS